MTSGLARVALMDSEKHLAEIRARLSASAMVETIVVPEERSGQGYGYFRPPLTLVNQDVLEVAEYFVVQGNAISVPRYRHQWMDRTLQVLKKRWDNTRHYPHRPDFPHHIHIGSADRVVPASL